MTWASDINALASRIASEFNTLRGQLASALAGKADDASVVKLSGSQTVGGAKTFTAAPSVPSPGSPGNPVRHDDGRLSDQRHPIDGSVTNNKVAGGAGIEESKLSLASDAAAGEASRRSLGSGARQAAAGDHTHAGSSSTGTFNVRDYGAVGNGTTNDLGAINAAIAACPPGGRVWFPPGVYLVNGPIDVPSNITLEGVHGDTLVYPGGVAIPPCTIRATSAFSGAAVIRMRGKSQTGLAVDHVGARLRNLTIDGTGTRANTAGVLLYGFVREATFDRVTLVRLNGNGFECNGPGAGDRPQSLRFLGCVAHDVIGTAFNMIDTADTTWHDCNAQGAGQFGFYFVNAPNGLAATCRAEWAGQHGFAIAGNWGNWQGSGGISLNGCLTDRSAKNGMYVSATGAAQVQINGCTFRRDGRNNNTGGGGFAAVLVDPAATMRVIITNIGVYPGVDDGGAGTPSPQLGLSAPAGGASVSISSADLFAATSPIGGGADLAVDWDTISVAIGTPGSFTRRTAGTSYSAGTLPATWTPDYANGPRQVGVAGAAVTVNPPSTATLAPRDGAQVTAALTATGASRVITLGTGFGSLAGWPSSLQLAVGKAALVRFEWNAAMGRWIVVTFAAEA